MIKLDVDMQRQRKGKRYLKDEEEEEVGISQPPELLKQIKRQKGEYVVLGGPDGIVLRKRK